MIKKFFRFIKDSWDEAGESVEERKRLREIKEELEKDLYDSQGRLIGEFVNFNREGRKFYLGINDVAGWSYREETIESLKKKQRANRVNGKLEEVTIQSDRGNKHDNKAIKVLIEGEHVGFVPKRSELQQNLNYLIDEGYESKVFGEVHYEKDREHGILVEAEFWMNI